MVRFYFLCYKVTWFLSFICIGFRRYRYDVIAVQRSMAGPILEARFRQTSGLKRMWSRHGVHLRPSRSSHEKWLRQCGHPRLHQACQPCKEFGPIEPTCRSGLYFHCGLPFTRKAQVDRYSRQHIVTEFKYTPCLRCLGSGAHLFHGPDDPWLLPASSRPRI